MPCTRQQHKVPGIPDSESQQVLHSQGLGKLPYSTLQAQATCNRILVKSLVEKLGGDVLNCKLTLSSDFTDVPESTDFRLVSINYLKVTPSSSFKDLNL
ncbi:UNVERIFIED_CONTAM: hypothetical protein FKN15_056868 [Acipenser sinensis]